MILLLSKLIVLLFGVFFILTGFLMLFKPVKARQILQKAGSTNLINYAEIIIRMIPAIGMILYADFSRYPEIFKLFGWFMLATSFILLFIPRRLHHQFSLKSADILKPLYFRIVAPFALMIGVWLIYAVV
jgi:uncharacterized membrane protein YfcA